MLILVVTAALKPRTNDPMVFDGECITGTGKGVWLRFLHTRAIFARGATPLPEPLRQQYEQFHGYGWA